MKIAEVIVQESLSFARVADFTSRMARGKRSYTSAKIASSSVIDRCPYRMQHRQLRSSCGDCDGPSFALRDDNSYSDSYRTAQGNPGADRDSNA